MTPNDAGALCRSKYRSRKELFAAYPDRKLKDFADCVGILNAPDVIGYFHEFSYRLTAKKMHQFPETDQEIIASLVAEITQNFMRNPEKIQARMAAGCFTASAENATDPSVHAMLVYYHRACATVANRKVASHRKKQRLPPKLQTDPAGEIRYATRVGYNPSYSYDDALDLSTGGTCLQAGDTDALEAEKEAVILRAYYKTMAEISNFQRQYLEEQVKRNSASDLNAVRALLAWQSGKFKTAEAAAEYETANTKKVREIWDNLNRTRNGRCKLHRWLLKRFPEKTEKTNAVFERWYWFKNTVADSTAKGETSRSP